MPIDKSKVTKETSIERIHKESKFKSGGRLQNVG